MKYQKKPIIFDTVEAKCIKHEYVFIAWNEGTNNGRRTTRKCKKCGLLIYSE